MLVRARASTRAGVTWEAASRRAPCQVMTDITYAISIPAHPKSAMVRRGPVLSPPTGLA